MPSDATATATSTGEGAKIRSGVLIEARDLRKSYRAGAAEITVLSGVNVRVEAGELIAVVGPSGAGKSTLLHLLAALDTPTSGTVYFEQKAIESFRESELADYRNRSIGFVWQRHHLLADFTAAENVAMPLLMRGAGYSEALETSAAGSGKSAWKREQHSVRGSCPEGSNSAWRSLALLCRSRPCCWPMSPPEISTSETQSRFLS